MGYWGGKRERKGKGRVKEREDGGGSEGKGGGYDIGVFFFWPLLSKVQM